MSSKTQTNPSASSILEELQALGDEKTKAMLMRNHGVREPCFGVKIGDMKPIVKRIKKDHQLALALYDTGNYDAQYFAGLIADDAAMSKTDLNRWMKNAIGGSLSGFTVPWVTAGNPKGWEIASEWIDSDSEQAAECGWGALGSIVALRQDEDLDLQGLERLLKRVEDEIPTAPDLVRYAMNGFLISVGCYVASLSPLALEIGERLGKITANLGPNACKIPYAPDYIRKVEKRGAIGKKRKTVKC